MAKLPSFCLARCSALRFSSAARSSADMPVLAASLAAFFAAMAALSRSALCAGVRFSVLPLGPAAFLAFFSLDCSRLRPRAMVRVFRLLSPGAG